MFDLVMIVGGLAGFVCVIAALLWTTRHSDATVANRMNSPDRVDGTRDPHAYLHHSSY